MTTPPTATARMECPSQLTATLTRLVRDDWTVHINDLFPSSTNSDDEREVVTVRVRSDNCEHAFMGYCDPDHLDSPVLMIRGVPPEHGWSSDCDDRRRSPRRM